MRKAHNSVDLAGQRFFDLLVIEESRVRVAKNGKKRRMWRCLCSCGSEVEVDSSSLRSGNNKSCGCRGRRAKDPKRTAMRCALSSYKSSARQRGIYWNLPDEMALRLMYEPCCYCGSEPTNVTKMTEVRGAILARNGIDRLDPSRGYEEGNVVSCCKRCNVAKASMLPLEFISWATAISENLVN